MRPPVVASKFFQHWKARSRTAVDTPLRRWRVTLPALGVVHDLADQAAWPEDLGRPELRGIGDDFEPP
ncbi:hypothetical protein ACFY5K_35805 [Streptomyces griseofuscus]|uniref:hypothetical protein n=1 Tax=Streptomyces griseofuscus TaxID=146922 RepID=UPI003682AF5C